METTIQIINNSHHPIPTYATVLSAGMDLRAFLPEQTITIHPGERKLISTGLQIALPEGFEAQVRPRSGLAFKHGITVLNSPGTIDADYRGDIGVLLINQGDQSFVIEDGERIAQMVIARYEKITWDEVKVLSSTKRGSGGFGHTGGR